MSSTRFYNDNARIEEQNRKQTYIGRYQIDMPGPGNEMPFLEDPYFRLEGHGANLTTNKTDLESDFRGLTRKLNRDLIQNNNYEATSVRTQPLSYGSQRPYTQESRSSHPAWTYKDLEQSRWELPMVNPQLLENLERPFNSNMSSRILEKDNFKPTVPDLKK
jgi:hypothetical protein